MASIDHGEWQVYEPSPFPPDAPRGALFVQRQSDGVDWYDYVRADTHFDTNTVKFTALWQDMYSSYVVSVATYDETMLFPANQLVREITDYAGSDPQADFGNKLYDPATDSFSDPPPLSSALEVKTLLDRIEALEAQLKANK